MSNKDWYKRQADGYEWDYDHKPRGNAKRHIHARARSKYKRLLRDDMEEWEHTAEIDHNLYMHDEIEEALYCHYHGPCERCKESGK
jgi:hypothetical protein